MGLQEYSEEELVGKKYNELLKISKARGVKTCRRLKTDKLIEAILKCQQEEVAFSLSQDAEAVATAFGSNTFEDEQEGQAELLRKEEEEEEELLLDIQFPECASQALNSLKDSVDEAKSSLNDLGSGKHKAGTPIKTHKRSGTYDVEEEEDEKREGGKEGREKQQTFDLTSSTKITHSINEKKTEENSRHLSLLAEKVTVRGSRRNGASNLQHKAGDPQPASKSGLTPTTLRRCSQTAPASRDTMPPSPWQRQSSLTASGKRQRRSVTVTPSAPAPPLRPSQRSQGTPFGTPALNKPTTAMASTTSTVTTTSTSLKPVFTLGCGDSRTNKETNQENKHSGKGSSGIPRFLSYARRLKVPNFARIHEQAFQRMDGLDDYVDKRRARQDTLGSTTKKQQPKPEVFQPSVTSIKSLDFDFAEESPEDSSGTAEPTTRSASPPYRLCDKLLVAPSSSEPLDTVPCLSSPMSSRAANTGRDVRVSRRVTRDATKPLEPLESSTKPGLTRKSARVTHKPSPKRVDKVSPKTGLKVTPKPGHKGSPQAGGEVCPTMAKKVQTGPTSRVSHSPVLSKKLSNMNFLGFGSHIKNCKPGKQSVSSPVVSKLLVPSEISSPTSVRKRMQEYSLSLASRKMGYVPYKGAVKPLRDRNELKTLAERKHKVKSSKEIRERHKGILKGVRLNKRFELQMANRGITL